MKYTDIVVGEWYECDPYGTKFVFRADKVTKYMVESNLYGYNDKSVRDDAGSFSHFNYMKPANMEDVLRYFPNEEIKMNYEIY